MAMDSTPAYGPTRALLSTQITDSTAAGRALLTGASAAAQRTTLGLSDLSTLEHEAIAHANSVMTFTYTPHHVFSADGAAAFGSNGSRWNNILSGTGARTVVTSGETGGASQYTTGATASSSAQWLPIPNGLGAFSVSFVPNLTAATAKWHVQVDFKYTTTPDSQTQMSWGWVKPDGTPALTFGVQGSGSTTLFRLYTDGGSGTNSNVTIDTKRHRFRMWHDGSVAAGTVNWSIDDVIQTAVTGYSFANAAGPYGQIQNGTTAAAQTVILYSAVYQTEGVQIPPP